MHKEGKGSSRSWLVRRALAASVMVAATLLPAVPGAGESAWLPPSDMTPSSDNFIVSGIAAAPDGTIHAVGISLNPVGVAATRKRPGLPWEDRVMLLQGSPDSDPFPNVLIDGRGVATALWVTSTNQGDLVHSARRPAGGAWEPAVALSAVNHTANSQQMDVAPNGTVTAVWRMATPAQTDYKAQSATRTATGSWSAPVDVSDAGVFVSAVDVAVDDDGRATAVWTGADESGPLVQSADRPASGGWTDPGDVVVPTTSTDRARVEANGAGDVVATWHGGNDHNVARRLTGSAWEAAGTFNQAVLAMTPAGDAVAVDTIVIPGTVDTAVTASIWPRSGSWSDRVRLSGPKSGSPGAMTTPRGTVLVSWSEPDGIHIARKPPRAVWQHDGPVTGADTPSDAYLAADPNGNLAVAWSVEGAGDTFISKVAGHDGSGPVATMSQPSSAWSLAGAPVAWSARDVWSDVDSYTVQVSRAEPASDFFVPTTWRSDTTTTSGTYTGMLAGSTYCFSTRAIDSLANVGAFSAQRCTAAPLDDRALTASPGWARQSQSASYKGTQTTTSTKSATLTSAPVRADQIALVATKAPGAGTVDVFLGTSKLKSVSLASATVQRKQIIPIANFTSRRAGKVRIVATSAKPVTIDGLGSSAR